MGLCACAMCLLPAGLKRQLLSRQLVNASDILGGSHCLAPACLRASVASSLRRLRLGTIDLLYLHNAAEVQLAARGKEGFFEVLRAAFEVSEVKPGCLACADLFRVPLDTPTRQLLVALRPRQ